MTKLQLQGGINTFAAVERRQWWEAKTGPLSQNENIPSTPKKNLNLEKQNKKGMNLCF